MATPVRRTATKTSPAVPIAELADLAEVDERVEQELKALSSLFNSPCFPLIIPDSMTPRTVDDVFETLRSGDYKKNAQCLIVVIDSPGGDINSAYNLALLFRRYAKKLHFIVPRWAKSAATLLVCAGDEISMTPVAEVGPVDPQITVFNPIENRLEQFSPLHIESTLELIRSEFANGNSKLAEGLLLRLQFPLTLGSFKTSLDVGKVYLQRLLSTRMMADKSEEEVKAVAEKFVEGYTDHGFVIGCHELDGLGLNVNELDGKKLDVVWSLHLLNRRRHEIMNKKEQEAMEERIKQLPPDLFDLNPLVEPARNGATP